MVSSKKIDANYLSITRLLSHITIYCVVITRWLSRSKCRNNGNNEKMSISTTVLNPYNDVIFS